MNLWISGVIAFLLSCAGTYFVRRWALRSGLLDVPNARSSHQEATPRGGGIAIVGSVSVMLTGLALSGSGERLSLSLAIVVGGLVIAAVGYLDDRYHLHPIARLVAHMVAAIWAVAWLGGVPEIQCGNRIVDLGWVGDVVGVVALVWALNLFNFMDGIDGIAASEATFMCLAGALLAAFAGRSGDVAMTGTVVGLASAGFLVWNWPRAKIFMGDVGSGYLGYVIGVIAIADAREGPAALFVWLILGGVFFMDATVTLIRRLLRRERAYEAHRSHAYQWLARRWKSHRRVTVTVLMVNLLWLFPCALLASRYPAMAVYLVLAALVPIGVSAVLAGAGRSESSTDRNAYTPG